jgi:hypothetical protein
MMSRLQIAALAMLAAVPAFAQAPASNPYTVLENVPGVIKGTMDIQFGTRTQLDQTGKAPRQGAVDVYTVDLEVGNAVLFQGKVERRPWLPTSFLGNTLQEGYLSYDLNSLIRNPANPAQTAVAGRWIGAMTLDGAGKYSLVQSPADKGRVRLTTNAVGATAAATANFNGEIQGRKPEQAGLWGLADRASTEVTKTYGRYVNGVVVAHTVKGADPVKFVNATLAAGPVSVYPETVLNGSIDYDSEEGNWYLDVTASYASGGATFRDRYSGSISWTEDPNRKTNGKGFYTFNVRTNEKPVTEADLFKVQDAFAAFFATDNKVPGFTGTINYVDTFRGESVIASKVNYAVDGNQVSKIQAMNLAKILLLMIGPFNDE